MQATGGTITTNGTSKVHTFSSSGTFTFYGKGTAKVLWVGGGANSPVGAAYGAGGAGEYIYDAAVSLSTGVYTVTINGAGGSSIFNGVTADPGSGSTSGNGYTKGSDAGGPYGSSAGAGGGSSANGGNAGNYGDWTYGGTAGAGTANSITGASVTYACGGSGGPSSGGSNYSGQHGARVYGDGQGSNFTVWHDQPATNPCPALGGVVIISYVYASADSGIRVGDESISYEDLASTHKVRFNKGGTIVGLPLVATDSAIAAATRVYDGSAVKALVKLP